jgi:type III pantothenate kinase
VLLAAVDIGNTRIRAGFYRGARRAGGFTVPVSKIDVVNRRLRKAGEVAVSSVNPRGLRKLRHGKVMVMGRDFAPLVSNNLDHPKEVGMDRLANASGAYARSNGASIVVDVGTAVTFDCVDRKGAFIGGIIAPGQELGARALSEYTALLPKVRPEIPRRMIGRRTVTSIQSGLHLSIAGLLERGIREARREMKGRVTVFGTGGGAQPFRKMFDSYVPTLTLEGIRVSHAAFCDTKLGPRPRRNRRR